LSLRIAYITDSHLGASGRGYHQQSCWVGGWALLTERLRKLCDEQSVDLVIHGGDMVDDTIESQIRPALEQLSSLGRPVLACLGNHDICQPDPMPLWERLVAEHPDITLGDVHRSFDECDIYVINNHWDDGNGPVMYWDPTPPYRFQPCIADPQVEWLDKNLSRHHDRPAIVVIHTQLDRVPASDPRLHDYIPKAYPQTLNALFDRHPHVQLVLSGHCHVTALAPHGQRMHLTTGALCEIPFHVRLIEVHDRCINVTTPELGPAPDEVKFIEANAWAVGTEKDQQFVLPICEC
jgi:3',5'-cyclic AMP phosphodiesterase CpdA